MTDRIVTIGDFVFGYGYPGYVNGVFCEYIFDPGCDQEHDYLLNIYETQYVNIKYSHHFIWGGFVSGETGVGDDTLVY